LGSLAEANLQIRLEKLLAHLQAEGAIRGMQVGVAGPGGKLLASVCAGELGAADPRPVKPETLFCVFSAGKPLCAVAALQLAEQGQFKLQDVVKLHWPEFGANGKEACTVEDVLRHRAGLASALPQYASINDLLDMDAMAKFVANASPDCVPGTTTAYHYLTFGWILAGLVKATSGDTLDELIQSNIVSMLGLSGEIYLGVPAEILADDRRFASVEVNLNGPHQAEEQSSSTVPLLETSRPLLSPALFNMRRVREARVPAANLHCSARALARFYAGLGLGRDGNSALLQASTLQELQRPVRAAAYSSGAYDQTPDAGFGLGVRLLDFGRCHGFGHAGLGGSVGFAVPELGFGVAVTVNRLEVNGEATGRVISTICEELGITPPASLVGSWSRSHVAQHEQA